MKNKNLILFDIGAVLLELNYNGLFEAGAKYLDTTSDEFKEIYNNSNLEPRVLSGEISNEVFLDGIRNLLNNKNLSEKELKTFFRNAWGTDIKETIQLKKQLHEAGNTIGLFSNINYFAIDILSKEYPEMFETFGGPKIFSYLAGATKSKSNMFDQAQKLGFNNIIYLDDNARYVTKGVECGWNGILFTPHIDRAEAIRTSEGTKNESTHLHVANSFSELEQVLRDFKIEF